MKVKEFFGKLASKFVLLNLAAMAIVVVLLMVGVKFGLEAYTRHGEGIEVPALKGMTYHKARLMLEEKGLTIVVSDSGYNKQMPAESILVQTPGPGTKVKEGHAIYVTVNSPSSPSFAIPDIVDNSSVREAEARLMAMGFKLSEPQMVTGEKDWVYGIICRGRRVSNGDRIPIDYPLTLMVGSGMYEDEDDATYEESSYSADEESGEADTFVEITEPGPANE